VIVEIPNAGTKARSGKSLRIGILTLLAIMLFTARPGQASDIESLATKLAAALIADQTVFLCTLEYPSFARDTAGPRGTSRDYVEHIKAELLRGVPALEVRRIVVAAANLTRETGRRQAHAFSPNYPDIPAAALRRWCASEGSRAVRDFMASHDQDHTKFLDEVADAKRPTS